MLRQGAQWLSTRSEGRYCRTRTFACVSRTPGIAKLLDLDRSVGVPTSPVALRHLRYPQARKDAPTWVGTVGRPQRSERTQRLGAPRPLLATCIGRLNMAEGYCVKDKKKVEIQNPEKITMKNGKPAVQGTCPSCGGKVFRIGA